MPDRDPLLDGPARNPLADRIVSLLATRGYAGITGDELLRHLEITSGELRAALIELEAEDVVRVAWTAIDSFRVFYTA